MKREKLTNDVKSGIEYLFARTENPLELADEIIHVVSKYLPPVHASKHSIGYFINIVSLMRQAQIKIQNTALPKTDDLIEPLVKFEKQVDEMATYLMCNMIPELPVLELINSYLKYEKYTPADLMFCKLHGSDTYPGNEVYIIWDDLGYENPDKGYLFELPGICTPDEGDIFVHIPKPQNPGGMDNPPPVFLHLFDILTNEDIVSVEVIDNGLT